MKSNLKKLVEKSISSAVSAIEIYNKPNFLYREETFAILMINAWELLLKAQIVSLKNNSIQAIYQYKYKERKDGTKYTKQSLDLNRSGNPKTINIHKAISVLKDQLGQKLDNAFCDNLDLLIEIRDNSLHFNNDNEDLKQKILEIGTATLKNYLAISREWFQLDLSKYNFYLMPLSFFNDSQQIEAVKIKGHSKPINLFFNLIQNIEKLNSKNPKDLFNVTLNIETRFTKSTDTNSLLMKRSNNPTAIPFYFQEEDITKEFCWDYDELTKRLKAKYVDFKIDKKYHGLKKTLRNNPKFCNTRYLDPKKKTGTKKDWYNPNIIIEFDKHYKQNT